MPQFFTLKEAEGLLPSVGEALRRALAAKRDFDASTNDLQESLRRIAMLGGSLVDRDAILSLRNRQHALASRFKEAVEEVQEFGCLLKDLDIGLVDFPTLYRGREVYLCWRLGEPSIRYWHGVDEGFAGRKEIDSDFLSNHSGSRPA